MTLRRQTLLIISVTLVGLVAIVSSASRIALIGSFEQLEEQGALQDVQRALDAVQDDLAKLDQSAGDWANWDDTYAFVRNRDPRYVRSNLTRSAYQELRLNAFLLADQAGRLAYGRGYDLRAGVLRRLPRGLRDHFGPGSVLLRRSLGGEAVTGILMVADGPMMVAVRPVRTSEQAGPVRGALVLGRFLDDAEIHRLAELSHLSLSLAPQRADAAIAPAPGVTLSVREPTAIAPEDANTLVGYHLLRDVYDRPALTLRVQIPRQILQRGRAALRYLVLSLLFVGLVFGGVTWWLLERRVLSRVSRLSAAVTGIRASRDLKARLSVGGRDELSGLADAMNQMLEALQRRDAILQAVAFAAERLLEAPSWEARIGDVLERLGLAAEASMACIVQTVVGPDGERRIRERSTWVGLGVDATAAREDRNSSIAAAVFRGWYEALAQGEGVQGHTREMPPEERAALEEQGVRSLVVMPITVDHHPWGWMGLYAVGAEREWSAAEVSALHAAAGTLGSAIQRERADEEHRRLEAQIQHAQKLESLGVLAGGIAHDFNNLLMGVMGNAGLALMKLPADSPARANIERIETSAVRAGELTNQMLAYAGKGKLVVQGVDLSSLVEEMAHLMRAAISKKVTLTIECAPGLPTIQADATQVRQVVMNLITNASDAIGDQIGTICVRTGTIEADRAYLASTYLDDDLPPGLYTFLEVSDTGCGMDADTRARIFEPFFTTKFAGRGLGLAAVLGIVRGHRGALKVDSEPGRGTVFRVLFPAVPGEVAAPTHPGQSVEGWRGSGLILVVDDEEPVRAVARWILEEHGFSVVTATNGREGVALFQERAHEVAAVLLDMTMPEMSGEEALREIRRIRRDARVILSSGYSEQDATGRFGELGLDGFIQKPYRPAALIRKLRELLAEGEGRPAVRDPA